MSILLQEIINHAEKEEIMKEYHNKKAVIKRNKKSLRVKCPHCLESSRFPVPISELAAWAKKQSK